MAVEGARAQRRILLVAGDGQLSARFEQIARHGRWGVAVKSRIAEAEHALTAGDVLAVVLTAADAHDDALRRLSRTHPTCRIFVWGGDLSSAAIASTLLAGATDVLTSRMGDAELFARIARATATAAVAGHARIGELEIDNFRGEATWRGERIPLTNRERDVLDVLAVERGRTLRREVIYQRVWGHAMPQGDRNVSVNVKRLRTKLRAATDSHVSVETISGVGYRLDVVEDTSQAKDGQ